MLQIVAASRELEEKAKVAAANDTRAKAELEKALEDCRSAHTKVTQATAGHCTAVKDLEAFQARPVKWTMAQVGRTVCLHRAALMSDAWMCTTSTCLLQNICTFVWLDVHCQPASVLYSTNHHCGTSGFLTRLHQVLAIIQDSTMYHVHL